MNPQTKPLSRAWAARLRPALLLDLRSLALLRAGLALALLCDALGRLGEAGLLYADSGLLPRAAAMQLIEPLRLSLHLANGSAAFAVLLTLVQALTALALLFGWRTRLATAVAWVLAVSAMTRNPLVADAADACACALLFWGLFLPWQARWSVDAAAATERNDNDHVSIAGSAALLHLLSIPLLAVAVPGIAAWNPALAQALSPLAYGRALGAWLLEAPALLDALISATAWMALAIAPLALLPLFAPWPRRLALVLSALLCLLLALTLDTGGLPWIALCGSALLIDGGLWQRLARTEPAGELRIYHGTDAACDRRCARLLQEFLALPACRVQPAQDSPRAERLLQGDRLLVVIDRDERASFDAAALTVLLQRSPLLRPLRRALAGSFGDRLGARLFGLLRRVHARSLGRIAAPEADPSLFQPPTAAQSLVAVLALSLLIAQLIRVGWLPSALAAVVRLPLGLTALDQTLLQLDPAHTADSGWLVVPGARADETEFDVLAGRGAPDYSQAQDGPLDARRWRLLVRELPGNTVAQDATAAYLCREANRDLPQDSAQRLLRLRLVLMGAPLAAEQRVLSRHDCGVD